MNAREEVVVMRLDREGYPTNAAAKKDPVRVDVVQYAGYSTAAGDVPSVRKELYNTNGLNLNLLEGYDATAPGLDKRVDRHIGLLHYFQLALININGGSEMIRRKGGFQKSTLLNCNFVSSRAALVRIGMRLYDSREVFRMVAVRRSGVIFLHELPTDENSDPEADYVLENQYVGHRFRQIMTEENDPRCVTDFEDRHYGIQHIKLGRMNILARSVVDCVTDPNEFEYVELKTHRARTRNIGEVPDFGIGWMKGIRWWLQMSLTGMRRLVVGVRDHNNVLKETLQASQNSFLPPDFNTKVMMVFLEDSLAHIEKYMNEVPEGSEIIFRSGYRNRSDLCATYAERDYGVLHPSFERLLSK